jgi:serine/threonine-protein kinase
MLYEMLTGQRPVDAETVDELLRAHLQHYPPPPSVVAGPTRPVPPELDALVLRCLAKQPERRPSTMREVAEALRRAVTEEECGTATLVELDAPPSRLPPSQARPRRRRWPRLASALALLAAAPVIAGSQVAEIWTAAVGAERARERPAPVVLDPAPLYQEVVPPPEVQKAQLKQLKKKRVRDRNRPRRSRSARARVRGAVVPRVEARRVVAGTVAAAESTRPAADVAPTFSLGLRTTVDPFEQE